MMRLHYDDPEGVECVNVPSSFLRHGFLPHGSLAFGVNSADHAVIRPLQGRPVLLGGCLNHGLTPAAIDISPLRGLRETGNGDPNLG